MIFVKLHHPVILRKQLPELAKQMNVEEKDLKDLLCNRSFYGVKADGCGMFTMPDASTQMSSYFNDFEECAFCSDAVVEYAKLKGVDAHPITEIILSYDLFDHYPQQTFDDVVALVRRVEERDTRVGRLDELNAPEVIKMNELRMVQEATEFLESNEQYGKSIVDSDGRILKSLKDVGWSLVNGAERKELEYNDEEEELGYSPSRLAVLVRKAIGTSTQEKFAFKAGLARVYLSRLANGKSTSTPTEVTLKKIAKATNEVTENELRLACGYAPLHDDKKEVNTKRRASLTDADWMNDNVKSFIGFLKKMIPLSEPLSSLNELQSSYKSIFYDYNDQVYIEAIGERDEYDANNTAANVIMPIRVRWFSVDRVLVQTMYIALIGHMSVDDEFYVTGYLTSVRDLHKHVPAFRSQIDTAVDANLPDGVDIMEYPVFYTGTHVKAAMNREKKKIEDRINAYFDSLVKVRVDGYGFFTDTLSEADFKKFLKNHEATMTSKDAPADIRDFYENVVVNDGDVKDFLVEDSDYDTVASVIAYVMNTECYAENHCNAVDGFQNTPESKRTESCVLSADIGFEMFEKSHGLKRDTVCSDLKSYAAELGLPYGRVSCYMMVDDKNADGCGVRV